MSLVDKVRLRNWIETNAVDVFAPDGVRVFKRSPDTFDDWDMIGRIDRFTSFKPRFVSYDELLRFLEED